MKLKSWQDQLQHSDEYPKQTVHDLSRVVLNSNSGLVNKVAWHLFVLFLTFYEIMTGKTHIVY